MSHDDLAEVVTAVARDDGAPDGAVLDVTGPAALTLDEVAAEVARAAGRPCRYVRETPQDAFARRLAAAGEPDGPRVDGWVSWYLAIAAGEPAGVSDVVPRLTGHPARSVADVLGVSGRAG